MNERDPMKIAGQNLTLGNKWGCPYFALDYSGGLGEAIAARMREVNQRAVVSTVNSSEKALNPERCYNVRAELWWNAWELIRDKKIPYPQDEELRRQLTSVKFQVVNSNGQVKLEPKEETKKRIMRSPDNADAFIIGLYKLWSNAPIRDKDVWKGEPVSHEVSSAVGSAMVA